MEVHWNLFVVLVSEVPRVTKETLCGDLCSISFPVTEIHEEWPLYILVESRDNRIGYDCSDTDHLKIHLLPKHFSTLIAHSLRVGAFLKTILQSF